MHSFLIFIIFTLSEPASATESDGSQEEAGVVDEDGVVDADTQPNYIDLPPLTFTAMELPSEDDDNDSDEEKQLSDYSEDGVVDEDGIVDEDGAVDADTQPNDIDLPPLTFTAMELPSEDDENDSDEDKQLSDYFRFSDPATAEYQSRPSYSYFGADGDDDGDGDYSARESSSFSKPFFPPQQNGVEGSYSEVDIGDDDEANDEDDSQRLQMVLCSVLHLCGDRNTNYPVMTDNDNAQPIGYSNDYNSNGDANSYSNGIENQEEPDNDTDTNRIVPDGVVQNTIQLPAFSGKPSNSHGHRVKRDLSWNAWDVLGNTGYNDDDDEETRLYKEQLDILADLLLGEDSDDAEYSQEETLEDVLEDIEGIRRDGLSAGEILEEFERDQELEDDMAEAAAEGLDDTNEALDNFVLRKRSSVPRDTMRHYVQSLPTLEGMRRKRGNG